MLPALMATCSIKMGSSVSSPRIKTDDIRDEEFAVSLWEVGYGACPVRIVANLRPRGDIRALTGEDDLTFTARFLYGGQHAEAGVIVDAQGDDALCTLIGGQEVTTLLEAGVNPV